MGSWTQEHEAKFQGLRVRDAELVAEIAAMQPQRHAAGCAVMKAIAEANNSINGYAPLVEHLREHGADLIALIKPFVKDQS